MRAAAVCGARVDSDFIQSSQLLVEDGAVPASGKVGTVSAEKDTLRTGDIDALYTARKPSTYDGETVTRLFPDYREVERAYWRETAIFPIMHVIAIRRDVYEANRWVAMNLFKAFRAAQEICYQDLGQTAALKVMLPWSNADFEDAVALMSRDFWPYGLARNRAGLETFLRYHHEQGLSPRLVTSEEMFAPETLEEFVI